MTPEAARAALLRGSNPLAVPLRDVPRVAAGPFADIVHAACAGGGRLAALAALADDDVLALLADDAGRRLGAIRMIVPDSRSYPALTARLPQAQGLERALFEDHGIRPEGHPWLKPLRRTAGGDAPAHPFFVVEGEGIHEVAVGPVHAGIIEPGHFRFQCHGGRVLHLEIMLGYQHRGAIALMRRSTPARRLAIAESIAGDTAVGHGLAHCMVVEGLLGLEVPEPAHAVRGLALELERLANHAGDLGALCGDIGYLPGASWLGRLRGDFLNLLAEISGNRFGRGLAVPGGARFGVPSRMRDDLLRRLDAARRDFRRVVDLVFDTPGVEARFESTGVVDRDTAASLGLVGPVARASGCDRDVRRDHAHGAHAALPLPVAVAGGGDVMARATVRRMEAEHALAWTRRLLEESPAKGLEAGPARPAAAAPGAGQAPPGRLAVALVEGWRGEIVHLAATPPEGGPPVFAIIDPSLHNWFGLAVAVRGNEISDFPLCNKSFNLSYAGHDL
jgi:Ni,Fe-hydrogenase III large subunit